MKKLNVPRLLGLGALGVPLGVLLIYAAILWASWPSKSSGMDPTTRFVAWFAVGGLLFAVVLLHVIIGKMLLTAKPEGQPIEMEHFDWDRPQAHH